MASKKNQAETTTSMPTLKIGSRVRCTDDGVTGRITWANGLAVKIRWDDGEQVTWKRDSLATRPIEILEADEAEPVEPPVAEPEATFEAPAEQPAIVTPELPSAEPTAVANETPVLQEPAAVEATTPIAVAELETPVDQASTNAAAPGATDATVESTGEPVQAPAPAKPKRQRKAKADSAPAEKKVSALDAAAKVLGETGAAMTCKELIGAMSAKGYWTSPGGKTPDATLYSALLREIDTKGEQARFVKAAPGRFALRPTA
jgi:HB1, ASXL, restriction endonuclease HTH domain